jgi:uncharacterized protein YndB with AHSA1/START domain
VISDDNVVVTTRVAVDPARAFEIFTREVDAWWRRGPRFRPGFTRKSVMRIEPGIGGRLLETYEDGDDVVELGRIRHWEPGARLVLDFRAQNFLPGQVTEVEVRFEAELDGTRVTLEHRGWSQIPAPHPARHGLSGPAFTAMIGSFWSDLLLALRAHSRRRGGDGTGPA